MSLSVKKTNTKNPIFLKKLNQHQQAINKSVEMGA